MTEEMSTKSIVLYADDDFDDLELVREAFQSHAQNVELITAADGFEAISYLKNLAGDETIPCLIILDINMPRMDGKEALTQIRRMKKYEDVPVILFTTSSQPKDKDFANKYNAGFITKPINYTQLDIIANKFIDHCTDEIKKSIKKSN